MGTIRQQIDRLFEDMGYEYRRSAYMDFNIADGVADFAARFTTLEPISTGGGADYVGRTVHIPGRTTENTLSAMVMSGEEEDPQPQDLREKGIVVFPDADGQPMYGTLGFPTVEAALAWLGRTPAPTLDFIMTAYMGHLTPEAMAHASPQLRQQALDVIANAEDGNLDNFVLLMQGGARVEDLSPFKRTGTNLVRWSRDPKTPRDVASRLVRGIVPDAE